MTPSPTDDKAFQSLEGLRGCLALAVVCGHFNFGDSLATIGLPYNFQLAVDVFFMLSGFVLTHSNYAAPAPVTPWVFVVKRFARLYPLHALTLVVMAALVYSQQGSLDFWACTRNLLLLHGDNSLRPMLNGPSWSIAIEFWGALLFLIVTRSFVRGGGGVRVIWLAIAVGVLGMSAALLFSVAFGAVTNPLVLGLGNYLRGVAGFFTGIAAYAVVPLVRTLRPRVIQGIGWLSLVIVMAFILADWPTAAAILFYLAGFALISSLAADARVIGPLSWRPCVWLGTLSYAIYLWHTVLYALLAHGAGAGIVKGMSGKAVLLPTLLAVAALTYHGFERPMQRLIRGSLSWRPRPVAAVSL